MNDVSVILRREETVGRLRVTVVEERVRVSGLNLQKIVQIGGLSRLECFVLD